VTINAETTDDCFVGTINTDGKRRSIRVANAMSRVKPVTEPDRFYRRETMLVFPRASSLSRGALGARIVITPAGVYRLECTNVCIAVFARAVHSLNGVSHPREISAPIITISIANRIRKGQGSQSVMSKSKFRELFVYHLDLLIEYLSGQPIDRHVNPVMLFPFHDEIVLEIGGVWLEMT
jgi:hypothetical protein